MGAEDERDLFPEALRIVDECRPKAVMLENVRGLLDVVFQDYRNKVEKQFKQLGYVPGWKLLNASDFGVSQLRPRVVFVGIRQDLAADFSWPEPGLVEPPTVGELLYDLVKANGWIGADRWPRLTPRMTARIQGFPDEWAFSGKKTAMYRQIGNAFPPPVAAAVARQIHKALSMQRIFKIA